MCGTKEYYTLMEQLSLTNISNILETYMYVIH